MRQYIGARYVPKFMGTYDPTQIYEALSVVDNGMGTDYISKIPTPAGTSLTDTTYWAIYGAYSGAILNLQDQINDMNDGSVPGSLQNQIDTIDGNLTPALSDIATLKNDVSAVTAKNIIIISDSYGVNFGTMTQNFLDLMNTLLTNLGYTVTTYATNGASFTRTGYLYETMLDNYTGDRSAINAVYVFGGLNDANYPLVGLSDIPVTTGVANFITHCKTNFPNAVPYFGFIGRGARPNAGTLRLSIVDYIKKIRDAWINNGGGVISNCEYVLTNQNLMQADGLHPNDDGASELAKQLTNAVIGKGVDVQYLHVANVAATATTDGYQIYEFIHNNLYELIASVTKVENLPAGLSQASIASVTISDLLTRDLSRSFGFINEKSYARIDGVWNEKVQFTIGDGDLVLGAFTNSGNPLPVSTSIDMSMGKLTCNSLFIG